MLYIPRVEVFTERWIEDLHRNWAHDLEDEYRRHQREVEDIHSYYQERLLKWQETRDRIET